MSNMIHSEALLTAKGRLLTAIYKHARFAADFEVTATNIDRPIADTPWLADHRYGDSEYDARWYSVMSAKDHFVEGLSNAIDDEIRALIAVAYIEGQKEAE